jgi:hypothetical protein
LRQTHDLTDTIVVQIIDDGHDERDFDTRCGKVLNRTQLHVKQISNAAVLVLLFAHAVELQVHAVLTGSFSGLAELQILGEADAVRRGQDAIETNLLCVSDGFEIVRR